MDFSKRVGFFLGAGFSYELGMPLVWQLTKQFKYFINADNLREFSNNWRASHEAFSVTCIDHAIKLIGSQDLHYENILGNLQIMYERDSGRNRDESQNFHSLYQHFIEIIYALLYEQQIATQHFIKTGFYFYEGFAKIVAECDYPLWIFSLNHDLVLEILAKHLDLPLKDGFWPDEVLNINIAPSTQSRKVFRVLEAEVLSKERINNSKFNFFPFQESGINLLKLHGALDIFAFRDGLDLCRLKPMDDSLFGRLKSLIVLQKAHGFHLKRDQLSVTNAIIYHDDKGELQFLRRSLLAGARKYDQRSSQDVPKKMLEVFKSYLNYVENLIVIGYSFGEFHIDSIILGWLELTDERSLTIVDPVRTSIPQIFAHLAPQVEIDPVTTSQFFCRFRDTPLSFKERLLLRSRKTVRRKIEDRALRTIDSSVKRVRSKDENRVDFTRK